MRLKNLQEVFESLEKKNLKKSQYAFLRMRVLHKTINIRTD